MVKCALSKSGFYLNSEKIYQEDYTKTEFCEKLLVSRYSHHNLHLWIEAREILNFKNKKFSKSQFDYDYPFPCSPHVRNSDAVYVHLHLIGKLNELTDESGESLRIAALKTSNYVGIYHNKTNITTFIDNDILPFVLAKTVSNDNFAYTELILPNLMDQLFDFFQFTNLLMLNNYYYY
uniref:Flagellar basal body rod protein FlgB n=1 Tax=Parastrongyloides trichosuri TaxID=131310 RepID=A0A0N4ZFF7_PARTI